MLYLVTKTGTKGFTIRYVNGIVLHSSSQLPLLVDPGLVEVRQDVCCRGSLLALMEMSSRFHRIYRYRRDKQPRDLDTLVASKLYFATIDGLNDPFKFTALRALADYPDKLIEYQSAPRILNHAGVTSDPL